MRLVQLVLPFGRCCRVWWSSLPGVVVRTSGSAALGVLCLFSSCRTRPTASASPSAGLVSRWPGEGNANDTWGTNNGVLLDDVTFAPGKVGQAFSFDGAGGYIRIADSANLHFTNAMTIEAWLYVTSLGANQVVLAKWDWTYPNAQKSYTTWVQPDGRIGFGVCDDGYCPQGPSGASATVVSTSSLAVNQWTHFAATYDESALRIYVNGVCENQTAYTDGIFPGTGDLRIGAAVPDAGGGGLYPFTGRIDEPAVYNRALSQAAIQAIYKAGSAGKNARR
jgi:Concanavalin A-like lectin/glucanases superfamily